MRVSQTGATDVPPPDERPADQPPSHATKGDLTPLTKRPVAESPRTTSGLDELESYFNGNDMCRYYKERNRIDCLPSRDTERPFVMRQRYNGRYLDNRDPQLELTHGDVDATIDTSKLLPHVYPGDEFHTFSARLYGSKDPGTEKAAAKVLLVEIAGTVGPGGLRYHGREETREKTDSYRGYLVVKVSGDEMCVTGAVRADVPAARANQLIDEGVIPARSGSNTFVESSRASGFAEKTVYGRLYGLMAAAESKSCASVDQDELRADLLRSPL